MLLDRGATIPIPHDVKCSCEECIQGTSDDSLKFSLARINAYRFAILEKILHYCYARKSTAEFMIMELKLYKCYQKYYLKLLSNALCSPT